MTAASPAAPVKPEREAYAMARCPDCDMPGEVVAHSVIRGKGIRKRVIRCLNDACAMETWRQITVGGA